MNCVYIRQADPLGLGHAVLCAANVIGNHPFAVILADDLIDADADRDPADGRDLRVSPLLDRRGADRAARGDVELRHRAQHPDRRGAARNRGHRREAEAGGGAEQPRGGRPLHPDAADLPPSAHHHAGTGGEIQLTDAIAALLERGAHPRLRVQGHPLRLRIEARLSAGDDPVRAAPPGGAGRPAGVCQVRGGRSSSRVRGTQYDSALDDDDLDSLDPFNADAIAAADAWKILETAEEICSAGHGVRSRAPRRRGDHGTPARPPAAGALGDGRRGGVYGPPAAAARTSPSTSITST